MRQHRALLPPRFASSLLLASAALALSGCSAGSDGAGPGGQTGGSPGGGVPATSGGAPAGSGGAMTSGGIVSSGGTSTGGVGMGGTGTGGAAGAATGGMGAATGMGGGGGGTGGSGGAVSSGGAPAGGAAAGDSSLGGAAGGDAAAGGTTGGDGGAATGGAGGGAAPCPPNASFCSGFDSAELPEGAVFKLNGDPATPWTQYFEIDGAVKHSGNSSLRTRSEINGYRMLAVPTGGGTFWVRLYIRSDQVLGEVDHNVFVQAAKTDDPNDGEHMEFAEDVGLSLHFDDGNIRWPEGYGRLDGGGTDPYTLAADAWHCLEFLFDGPGRAHQVYVDGTLLIDATDFPANTQAWSVFKFGYNALHGTVRNTWYDDVAVAPTRVGCL